MNLLIIGASARAAVGSAQRIGLRCEAIDAFGDLDLRRMTPVAVVHDWASDDAIRHAAGLASPGPWMYTGALENRPDLVRDLSSLRPLLGNPPDVLRAVRDPRRWTAALRCDGLPALAVVGSPAGLPVDGSWMSKPVASAGGLRIEPWLGLGSVDGRYWQRRVAGASHSAVFVGQGGRSRLLGVTRQFHGAPGSPFGYVGSVGPILLADPALGLLTSIGSSLASEFSLLGLFGVDFILREGVPWPVEINPRYTASVEVLEQATGTSLLAEHLRCFDPKIQLPPPKFEGRGTVYARRIHYARSPCRLPVNWRWDLKLPVVADLSLPGSSFQRGSPIFTLLGWGDTAAEAWRNLRRRDRRWRELLEGWPDPADTSELQG